MTIVDCISDLHGHYPELEGGDLLIVAGDLTANDAIDEYAKFLTWFHRQDYIKKILVAGNHDERLVGPWPGDTKGPFREKKIFYDFDYLCDSGTEFEGLKIWGSPWTKSFEGINPKCKAFTLETDEDLAEKWALIPKDTDILITHSPPYGIFDAVNCIPVGSKSLMLRSCEIKPKLHIFGHIHEQYGITQLSGEKWKTIYINASHVNEHYEPVNKPIRVIL